MGNVKKKSLGRDFASLGLNELLKGVVESPVSMKQPSSEAEGKDEKLKQKADFLQLRYIKLNALTPSPYQPRRSLEQEGLKDLSESIRNQGLVQPIVVRASGASYEIIAGERRWRAARLAGLTQVPVLVKPFSDDQARTIALVENLQREDLNAMEIAYALEGLIRTFSMTHDALARALGKSRSSISNFLRLLKLEPQVKSWVQAGFLDMGHAKALLGLTGEAQSKAAEVIFKKGLSVRGAEAWIKSHRHRELPEKKINHKIDAVFERWKGQLTEILDTQVEFRPSSKQTSKGKLIIHYKNKDLLEKIIHDLSNVSSTRNK